MAVLRENQIEIEIPQSAVGRKFDDESHGLSHCMKAVDFIVELDDRIYFIEIKDPDQSGSDDVRREYFERLRSGEIDKGLKTKFRDSWIYEWSENNLTKPVYYIVLIALDSLSAADLTARKVALERELPLQGPSMRAWQSPFVHGCAVFTIAAWNRSLRNMPVRRV